MNRRYRRAPYGWDLTPFADRVDRSGGPDACWPWLGRRHDRGYGIVSIEGESVRVNRLVLSLSLGRPLGIGLCACHRCDNPSCCNPAHLFEATHAENMQDMAAKGRARSGGYRPPRGALHHSARLTSEDVAEIRTSDLRPMQLARRFGVSHTQIRKIRRGLSWIEA